MGTKSISLIIVLLVSTGTIGVQQVFAGDEIMVLLRPSPFMYETDPGVTLLENLVFAQGDFGQDGNCFSDPFTLPQTALVGNPTGPLAMSPPSNYQSPSFVHSDPSLTQGMNPSPPSDLGLVDTIIKRGDDIVLNNIGDTATIPVEIVELSLTSSTPIQVIYNSGLGCSARAPDQFFDVFIDLDTSSSQTPGTMTLERTRDTSGEYSWQFPANILLRFENTNPSGTGAQNFPPEVIVDFIAREVPFSIFPEPVVGGEFIPIDATSLILAGSQTFSWMIPLVISGIGIVLFAVSRRT